VLSPVQAYHWTETLTWPKALLALSLFLLAVLVMFTRAFSPFLYFQF
jgi:uncharacterized membrane protein